MQFNGKEIKVAGMVRAKNSSKYLPRLFDQLSKVCDKIFVTDNESTDNTVEICSSYPKVMRFPTTGFNGGRDWRVMWKAADIFNPDWVIGVDSDELFEEGSEDGLLNLMVNSDPDVDAWSFPFFYCWGDESKYNVFGQYKDVRVIRVFRYSKSKLPKDISRHSTSCPESIKNMGDCDNIRMKHFGYMTEADRMEKWKHYCERDKDMIDKGDANYDHFGPDAETVLKDWDDWVPPLKVHISKSDNLRVGGYVKRMPDKDVVADYIYVSNWLEFSSVNSYMDMLKDLFGCLRSGKKFEIRVTDFRTLCIEYLKSSNPEDKMNLMNEFYNGYGIGFDYDCLKKCLEQAGFVNVNKKDSEDIWIVCNKPEKKEEEK